MLFLLITELNFSLFLVLNLEMSIPSAVKAKDLGNLAFKQGNLILALSNYSNAIELDRSNYIYPLNRSAVYLKQSK